MQFEVNCAKLHHCLISDGLKIVAANKSSCCKLSDRKVCARIDGKRRTQYSCKEVKDRPARTPNVVFVVALNYQLPSSYIFVLKDVFCRI